MLKISKTLSNSLTRNLGVRSALNLQPFPAAPQNVSFNKRSLSSTPAPQQAPVEEKKDGLWERWFGKEALVASESFKNRWAMVVPAIACHMCIGAPYAWSIIADEITREVGFVAPAAADWTLMDTALPVSLVFLFHGLSSATLGKWQSTSGPKKSMFFSAFAFSGSLALGALAIHFHSLPLLFIGYGALGGIGMGLGYTPPVQTLMQWFPDKKGIASAIAIAGFGSGALIFAPIFQSLMKKFAKLPEYLGPAENFTTQIVDGKLFADVNGKLIEVINAGAAEIAKIPYDLSEGLYIAGSGNTGTAAALATISVAYAGVIIASSLAIKNPHPNYVPDAMVAAPRETQKAAAPVAKVCDMTTEEVMKSSQFPLLGATFFCLAAGGMGLFSVAKSMMIEVFSTALPTIVNADFAAKFVLIVSSGNLAGRLAWGALSDKIGRKNTFTIFTLGSIPAYFSIPYLVDSAVATGEALPLYIFCGATMMAVSGMGGAFAILPAYEADLFGTKFVSAVHGRMLMFSSIAGVAGPLLLLKLRNISEVNAIQDLMTKVNPDAFLATFGAPMDKAADLVASKTLNISKLLTLCPPGTIDPTPYLYNTTMYTLSGAMVVAFLSHSFVRPTTPATVIDVKAKDENVEVKPVEEIVGDREVKKH